MVNASDASSLDYRFPRLRRPLTRATLARYTKIDYWAATMILAGGTTNVMAGGEESKAA